MDSQKVTINEEWKLYVTPAGKGFTCLGFENAQRKAEGVARWIGRLDLIPTAEDFGTMQGWEKYQEIMRLGGEYNRATGLRCPLELTPEFIGHEGERVEVTEAGGAKRRFYIGKSTGWMPIHLEISRRGSYGGGAVYLPQGATVRFTGKRL